MTHSNDTWAADTSDAMYSLDETEPGIDDVHSGSQEPAPTASPTPPGKRQPRRALPPYTHP